MKMKSSEKNFKAYILNFHAKIITKYSPNYAVDQPTTTESAQLEPEPCSPAWLLCIHFFSFFLPPAYPDVLNIGILLQSGNLSHHPLPIKLNIVNCIPDSTYNYPSKNMFGIIIASKLHWLGIVHGCITAFHKMLSTTKRVLCLLPVKLGSKN